MWVLAWRRLCRHMWKFDFKASWNKSRQNWNSSWDRNSPYGRPPAVRRKFTRLLLIVGTGTRYGNIIIIRILRILKKNLKKVFQRENTLPSQHCWSCVGPRDGWVGKRFHKDVANCVDSGLNPDSICEDWSRSRSRSRTLTCKWKWGSSERIVREARPRGSSELAPHEQAQRHLP